MLADPPKLTPEQITSGFQTLRHQQKSLVGNLQTFEMDLKEHITVIETLKTVDLDRKCFRLIGGVLCERTVKDVLPQLEDTSAQLQKHITMINEQLVQKGKEINKYRENHNIKIRGQDSVADKTEANDDDSRENRNILVADP